MSEPAPSETHLSPVSAAPDDQQLNRLVTLFDLSFRGYCHAETIIQARLYNFLFADSILLLSWAAVFAANTTQHKREVLIVLSGLSVILGLWLLVMGCRHRKFLFVHTQIITEVEKLLPESYRIHAPITDLQNRKAVSAGSKEYRLNFLEAHSRSRNFGIWAPTFMTIGSVLLLRVSFAL